VKHLDLHEFEQILREFKDDLQREANQSVLKRDVHTAASALYAIDAVERLAHRVQARAFYLGEEPEQPPANVKPFAIPAAPARRKRVKKVEVS
jgi:hypothetical protein